MSKTMIIAFNIMMLASFSTSLYLGMDLNVAVLKLLMTVVIFNSYAYFSAKRRKKIQ